MTAAAEQHKFLGQPITPLTYRRLQNFRANRRGWWSLWIFAVLFVVTLFAEFVANDKPILVYYDGGFYTPIFNTYPETEFGGEFPTEADYRDPVVAELIDEKGWMLWPLIRYNHRSVAWDLSQPAPSPPDGEHWLGTDDQARDVVARLIYGFRISVLFGFTLTVISAVIGVAAGAIQGYFGGWTDLLVQRFIEVWSGLPILYLLIILASVIEPTSGGCSPSCCCSAGWASWAWCAPSSSRCATTITCARRARSVSATSRSCTATSCPTPWSRPSPSCPSPSRAR